MVCRAEFLTSRLWCSGLVQADGRSLRHVSTTERLNLTR